MVASMHHDMDSTHAALACKYRNATSYVATLASGVSSKAFVRLLQPSCAKHSLAAAIAMRTCFHQTLLPPQTHVLIIHSCDDTGMRMLPATCVLQLLLVTCAS